MLAIVHARGEVGRLWAGEDGLGFAYVPSWLALGDALPLSPRLPLQETPWIGHEVAVFFANLLPEGALLDTLLKLRRLPAGNLYRQLEAFGRESAGAFAVVPEAEAGRDAPAPGWRPYPREALSADLARLRDRMPLLAQHGALRLSMAGAQDKIPVRYSEGALWLPENGAASTHILKPALQPERLFPDAVANEAFCLHLAGRLGLPVPTVTVLMEPEPVLLIERYDRVVDGDHIERLHQLDACQLTGVMPAHKYEVDGGPGFEACFAMVDRYSTAPARDRLQLVDWLLFNMLVGNADAHGKNLSMRYDSDGRLRLAPVYDVLATGYWPELDDGMAMAIGDERRPAWVQARHWQRLCEAVRLNATQLRRRALYMAANAIALAPEVLAACHASSALARFLQDTLQANARRMEQRLGVAE